MPRAKEAEVMATKARTRAIKAERKAREIGKTMKKMGEDIREKVNYSVNSMLQNLVNHQNEK